MSHNLHKKAVGYLEQVLILDSSDMFGARVLQVVCQICLGSAKNVGASLSDANHPPPAQLRGRRAFTYKSRACRQWIIAIWKYCQWRKAVKGEPEAEGESGISKNRRKRKSFKSLRLKSSNVHKSVKTPAALEEDALESVKRAHKENPYMLAPFCYMDIFNEVVEYLDEIDTVHRGSIEEALVLSTTLYAQLLEHSAIDGAQFTVWLRTFTTDLPLTPHPLLVGVSPASLSYQKEMYKGMYVSGCDAIREHGHGLD